MKKVLMLAALSTAMLASTAAMADRDGDHDGRGWNNYGSADRYDRHDRHDDHDDDRYEKHWRKGPPAHAPAYGYRFKKGDRLPREYRERRYYVEDWRARNLYEPPYGYRWTQVDGKYLLVSMANNVISNIVYGR